jgi:hypothetical protein
MWIVGCRAVLARRVWVGGEGSVDRADGVDRVVEGGLGL